MCSIPERYNEKVEKIIQMEKEGKVFVLRPESPVKVSRVEKDTKKLRALYEEGYQIGMKRFDEMMRWMSEK